MSCSRVLRLSHVSLFLVRFILAAITCFSSEDEVLRIQVLDLRDILLLSATREIHIGKTYFCWIILILVIIIFSSHWSSFPVLRNYNISHNHI